MTLEQRFTDFAVKNIVDLCKIPSPSGFTRNAEQHLINVLTEMGYKPWQTNKHAVLVEIGGQGNPLVLAAHIDTLGAMVRSIKGSGRLRFTKIGGYGETFVETENCLVHTREGRTYSGTCQVIRPSAHVDRDASTMERREDTVEIVLDEKVSSEKDVTELGIATGDFISFDPRTVVTDSGFIKSRHLDDKASAGILVALAKMVKEGVVIPTRKVTLMFTTYEEVGHGGCAGVPADTVEMISVDMGAVGDDLKTNEHTVSICAKDSGGPYDYEVTGALIEVAKKEELNYAVDIYPYYGSDVGASLHAGYDLRHGLIGPGVFASHGYERTHTEGVANTLALAAAYIGR